MQRVLGTSREAPIDIVFLRTVSEERDVNSRVAGSGGRGCSHLGCWVPVVLWCLLLGVLGVVAAIATTGRAMATGHGD